MRAAAQWLRIADYHWRTLESRYRSECCQLRDQNHHYRGDRTGIIQSYPPCSRSTTKLVHLFRNCQNTEVVVLRSKTAVVFSTNCLLEHFADLWHVPVRNPFIATLSAFYFCFLGLKTTAFASSNGIVSVAMLLLGIVV